MRYLLKRFLMLLLTGWAAITINFALPRLMPGNPAELMVARFHGALPPTAVHALELEWGLNNHQSIFVQYFNYLGDILTGNLGKDLIAFPTPVTTLIGQDLPWTLVLVGVATVVAAILATSMGIISAYKRGTWIDTILVPSNVMLSAMPQFALGIVFLWVFAEKLQWFPEALGQGIGQANQSVFASWSSFSDTLYHAVLPGVTLALCSMGVYCLLMRNSMVGVMQDDYVKFAKAKGLAGSLIAYKYAARNAILPVFTSFSMALGFVVAGAVFIEVVFSYPGIGYALVQSVGNLDYPLMQGIFLIIVLAVLLANFFADLVYVLLDPRIRSEARA